MSCGCDRLKQCLPLDVVVERQHDECGVTVQDYNANYEVGDVLECFEMRQVMRT